MAGCLDSQLLLRKQRSLVTAISSRNKNLKEVQFKTGCLTGRMDLSCLPSIFTYSRILKISTELSLDAQVNSRI